MCTFGHYRVYRVTFIQESILKMICIHVYNVKELKKIVFNNPIKNVCAVVLANRLLSGRC